MTAAVPHTDDPDSLAHAAYRLMQQSRYAEAVEPLNQLVAVADAAGRPDLCARGWTWLGQAHLYRNDLKLARVALRQGAAIAQALGDAAGLAAISDLRRAVGAKAMQAAPAQQTDTLVGRASAAIDAGDFSLGDRLAREAFEVACTEANPREQVLALLARARIPAQTEPCIRQAVRVADASNDRNLVTAVAHAARAAGVVLAPKVF